jgi:hypothetical protein
VDDQTQQRLAVNESKCREVNEAIERGQWPGDDSPVAFICECARLGCDQTLELTIGDYERIRRNPRRFVLVPGHELAEIETVAEVTPGYVVVEKRDLAGAVAARTDPRD